MNLVREPDTFITHWEFPGPSVTGIDYSFVIDSTSNVLPGLLCSEDVSLTIEQSEILALGLISWEGTGDTLRIEGLVDDSDYPDYTLGLPDRDLRLVDTHVGAWNVYPFDATILRMENDIFGEIMTADSSRTDIYNSICDGSGGHVMSQGTSEFVTVFSSMLTQVIARNRSQGGVEENRDDQSREAEGSGWEWEWIIGRRIRGKACGSGGVGASSSSAIHSGVQASDRRRCRVSS